MRPMLVLSCIPCIPCADVEASLRFWVEGLGLSMARPMRRDGRLIGCMVRDERRAFWLNIYDGPKLPPEVSGISLYWAPADLHAMRERLLGLGFDVSGIEVRDYGQTEFFVTDGDGHSHCFGVATDGLR